MSEAKSSTLRTATVKVEGCAARESAAATAGKATGTSREATSLPEAATTAASAHHIEEDFGVNAAHASTHASHSAHAAAAEHVRRIEQIFTTVIACLLPTQVVSAN
jgi:hypothetical protein